MTLRSCNWVKKDNKGVCELGPQVTKSSREWARTEVSEAKAIEMATEYQLYAAAVKEAEKRRFPLDKRMPTAPSIVNQSGYPVPDGLDIEVVMRTKSSKIEEQRPSAITAMTPDGFLAKIRERRAALNAMFRDGAETEFEAGCRVGGLRHASYDLDCHRDGYKGVLPLPSAIPVKLVLKGREYRELMPSGFFAEDKKVSLSVDGEGTFYLSNKTDRHISVSDITMYWGGEVNSIPVSSGLVLPPMAKVTLDISYSQFGREFNAGVWPKVPRGYKRLYGTRKDIETGSHEYGFAVSYAERGAGDSDTLYSVKSLPMAQVKELIDL